MRNKFKIIIFAVLMGLVLCPLSAADRYFKSGATVWNSANSWSATSSAGVDNAGVPGSSDIAYFDSGSGSCLIDANVDVLGLDSAGYAGILTQGNFTVTVRGSSLLWKSGTFIGSASSISIISTGSFILTGGIFTSTSGDFNCNNHFTLTAGTFNHNSGTVIMTTGSNATITSGNFYNLTINKATFTLTLTGNCVVGNTITFTAVGSVSGSDFEARGDIVFTSTNYYSSAVKIIVNGSGTQNCSGVGNSGLSFEINKLGGVLNFTSDVGFHRDYTYLAGTVNWNTYKATFLNSWNSVIASGNFYDVTINKGSYSITFTNTCTINRNLIVTAWLTSNGSNVEVKGDITFNSSVIAGTNTIIVNGTGTQNISGTGGCPVNFEINKSAGQLNFTSNVRFFQSYNKIAGVVNWNTNKATFSLGSHVTVTNGSFYDLEIFKTSSYNFVVSTTDLIVTNNLTLNTTLAINGLNIYFGNTLVSAGAISGGTSKILPASTGNQTTSGTANIGCALEINKTSGQFDFGANYQGVNSTYGNINFVAGTINQNNFTIVAGRFINVTGGVFNGSASNITALRFIQTDGIFTSTSGTLQVGVAGSGNYSFDITGGIFNHNNGSVLVSGSNHSGWRTLENSPLWNFEAIQCPTCSNVGTIYVDNLCKITNAAGGGLVVLKGDYQSAVGSPSLTLTGANNQTITATATVGSVTINKSGGNVEINRDITWGGAWNHIAGNINWNNYTAKCVTSFNGSNEWSNAQFYNLEIAVTSGVGIATLGSAPIVTNNLNMNCAAGAGTVPSVFVRGNVSFTTSNGAMSVLTLDGTGTQNISGVGTCNAILDINKASGSAELGANLTIAGAGRDLLVTNGELNLNGFNVVVPDLFTVIGKLKLKGTETITVNSIVAPATNVKFSFATGSTVEYFDSAVTAVLTNLTKTYYNLILGASKTHEIATGGGNGITVNGFLSTSGTNATRPILRSVSDAASSWELTLNGTSLLDDKVDVKYSDASSGLLVWALNSVDSTNNTNWNFITYPDFTWTGASDNNWNNAGNWVGGVVPGNSDTASFVSAYNVDCNINATVNVNRLRMVNGYTGTITQGAFDITIGAGNFQISSGVFAGSGNAITITGSFQQDGGVFTSTSGTFNTGGFALNGGTFNSNNGTFQCTSLNQSSGIFNGGASPITISGPFSQNGGTFNNTSNSFVATTLVVSGGAFNGSTASITLSTSFSQTGGIFTSTSGIMQVPGLTVTVFSISNGSFIHNNGTVRISGTFNPTVVTTAINRFYNLTLTSLTSISGALYVDGNLDVGTLNNFGSGVAVYLKGDFNGTLNTSNNGTIYFYGTGDQNFNGTRAPSVVVNKPSGNLIINSNKIIGNNWNKVQGNLQWNNYSITVSVTGSYSTITNGNFYDLIINNNNTTTLAGSDCIVTNKLTLSSVSGFNSSSYHFRVGGDIEFTDAVFSTTSASQKIILNGTGTQNITGAGICGHNLEINKTSGIAVLGANLSLPNANRDLTITAGELDLNGYNLSVARDLIINAKLSLKGIETITVNSIVAPASNASFVINSGSTIEFKDSAVTGIVSNVSNTFHHLILGAGKTHEFATGASNRITVNGTLSSAGTNANRSILRSVADASSTWELKLNGTSTLADKVDVKYSDASSGFVVWATNSVNSTNNTNWQFTGPANFTWTGAVNNNWNNAGNWVGGAIPGAGNVAIFSSVYNVACNIDAAVNVAGINISSGYTQTITQGSFALTVGTGNFLMQSGTFIGSSHNITISSYLQQNGGSFTSTSGELKVEGYTQTGGAFVHNVGKFILYKVVPWNSTIARNLDINSSITFYNFKVGAIGNTSTEILRFNLGASDTFIVLNEFEYFADNSSLETFEINGTGVVEVKGNIYIGANAGGGTATILVNGNTPQTYSGTTGKLPYLIVNTTNALSPALGTTYFSTAGFTLTNGTFNAPSNEYICQGNFIVNSGSFNHNNGKLSILGLVGWNSLLNLSIDVNTSLNLNHLKIYGQGSTANERLLVALGAGDTLNVAGNFEMISVGAGTLDTFNLNLGTIDVKGNIISDQYARGGSTLIKITGNTAQKYSGNAGWFPDIELNTTGSFQPDTGVVQFGCGALTITNGSFTSPNDLYVRKSFVITGGTFLHNNGAVHFEPELPWATTQNWTIDVNSSLAFKNISFGGIGTGSNENVTHSLGAGDILEVLGDLTFTANANESNIVNDGIMHVYGNVTYGGVINGGTTQLIFKGSADQILTRNAGVPFGGNVIIEKTLGKVILGSNIDLSTANQDLIVNYGTIDLAGFNLTVKDELKVFDKLNLKGSETITVNSSTASADLNANFTISATSSTVTYYDSAITAPVTNLAKTFYNLTFGAGKVHEFSTGSGNGIVVGGTLASNGSAASRTFLRSIADASIDWELTLTGTSTLANKVAVKRSDASLGLGILATNSIGLGNNTNWVGLLEPSAFTWTGAVDNNFNVAGNWYGGVVPTAGSDVYFKDYYLTDCTINANVNVKSISIDANYNKTITQSGAFTISVGNGGWTQNGGTFVGGSGAISVGGNYVLAGGVFTSTSGTLLISGGSWTSNSGAPTFNDNSGTVTIRAPYNTAISITPGSIDFNHVKIYSHGSGQPISFVGTMNIDGNLNLGSFDYSGTISGGTLSLKGNLTMDPNPGNGYFGGGNTVVLLNGTANQTITGNASPNTGQFPGITINKPSGDLILLNEIVVTKDWLFVAADNLISNTSTLTILAPYSIGQSVTATVTAGSGSYYNVKTNQSAYGDIQITDTWRINGSLTRNERFSLGGRLLGGNIELYGNLTNVDAALADGTTLITLMGTNTQNISAPNGDIPGDVLTINKTGGSVVLTSNLILNTASQDLVVTAGELNLNGFNITVPDVFTVTDKLKLKGNEVITVNGSGPLGNAKFTLGAASTVSYIDSSVTAVVTNLASTFFNLDFGAGKTHEFDAGGIIVDGVLSSSGSPGSRSVLRKVGDASSAWVLKLNGTSALGDKANVKYSDASTGVAVNALGSADSGNNSNWYFGTSIVSVAGPSGYYASGAVIPISVTYGGAMTVTGFPTITLATGSLTNLGTATYVSGTGSNVLVFNYTVQPGDYSLDLDYSSIDALRLSGGTIKNGVAEDANLVLPVPGAVNSLSNTSAIVVDTIAPTITSIASLTPSGNYKAATNITIRVNFSEAITLVGTMGVNLDSGGVAVISAFTGTSASCTYTVLPGQNSTALIATSVVVSGTAQDATLNNLNTSLPLLNFNNIGTNQKGHVINATASAGDGYQIKVIVHFGAGVDSGSDVYLNGKCRADFGDIRFSDSNNEALLSYWLEEKIDSDYAIFWVKINTDISTSNTTVNINYGNTYLSSTSNGSTTFTFFDDFSGDLSKWSQNKTSGVYPRIENTGADFYLRAGGGTTVLPYGHTSLGSGATFTGFGSSAVRFRARNALDSIGEVAFRGNFAGNLGYKVRFDSRASKGQAILKPPYTNGSWSFIASEDAVTVTPDTWYKYEATMTGSDIKFYRDEILRRSVTDATFSANGEIALQNHFGDHTDFDWVFVRKFIAAEPTHGSWGIESQVPRIVIDTTAPTISSITSLTADGFYKVGANISIRINFSEAITLTGTMGVNLDSGGVAVISAFTGTTATGVYTVLAGHSSSDLTATSVTLNTTALDAALNALNVSLPGTNIATGSNIVIDTTAPTITSITSSTANGYYKAGANISIRINFSESITLAGTMGVNLDSGGVCVINAFTGTTATGVYTVLAGENSMDLTVSSVTINTTARDVSLNDLNTALPGTNIAAGSNIVVDTTAPTITSITSSTADGIYKAGANISIRINFSESITLSGTMGVNLDSGGVAVISAFTGTTATGVYTVLATHSSSDLTATSVTVNSTARDAALNDLNISLPGTNIATGSNIAIDTATPTITSITSSTPNGIYGIGSNISIRINFSESITLTGTMGINLDSGGVAVISAFTGTTTTGVYTVLPGENSLDLTASSVVVNSSARDAALNDLNTTLPGTNIGTGSNIIIDSLAPYITSILSGSNSGFYNVGDAISISISFSEPVTLASGTLSLNLSSGGSVSFGAFSGTSTTGTYTVLVGENTLTLNATACSLSGGTFLDGGGASVVLSLPGTNISPSKTIVVDTIAPTISSFALGASSAYIDITFSEAVYNTIAGTGALQISDFNLVFSQNGGTATSASITSVTKTSGGALVGGETTYRLVLNIAGIITGVETITVSPVLSEIFDRSGNVASVATSTGAVLLTDLVGPNITNVTSAKPDGAYKASEEIDIEITFNENVTVSGTPTITLANGSAGTNANYISGSGTSILTFRYIVLSGDNSADLDYQATTALVLNGGTIQDAANNAATLVLPVPGASSSLGFNKNIVIDTITPNMVSGVLDTGNTYVDIAFSENIYAAGSTAAISVNDLQLTFTSNGGSATGASIVSLSKITGGALTGGEDKIRAMITVSGSVSGKETILIQAGSNKIFDKAGNVMAASPNTGVLNLVVSGTTPIISNVYSITPDGTYNENKIILIAVEFSEAIVVTGLPYLHIVTGSSNNKAYYTSNLNAKTLQFQYLVQAGDTASDLDYFSTDSLASGLNLIKGSTGISANVALPLPGAIKSLSFNSNIVIDTVRPIITSVVSAVSSGLYGANASIPIQIMLNRNVTLSGGNLIVTLDTGAVINIDSINGNIIEVPYITQFGEITNHLKISSLALSEGATIQDALGGDLNLTAINQNLETNIIRVYAFPKDYIISSASGENGTVSPIGDFPVTEGSTVQVVITPNVDYQVETVTVNGVSIGATGLYIFKDIQADQSIRVTFTEKNGFFSISANAGQGGSLSTGNLIQVAAGESTKISIFPNAGYHILDVWVDGVSVGAVNSYEFINVRKNSHLEAFFAINQTEYLITSNVIGSGNITPLGHSSVVEGGEITFKVEPEIGFKIKDVLIDSNSIGAIDEYTFKNVQDHHQITVVFEKNLKSYLIIPVAIGGGSVMPDTIIEAKENSSATISFAPNNNYHLIDVVVDGESVGKESSYTFTEINNNHLIVAFYHLTKEMYSIVSSVNNGGKGAKFQMSSKEVKAGGDTSITIKADDGYTILDIKLNNRPINQLSKFKLKKGKSKEFGSEHTFSINDADQDYLIEVEVGPVKPSYTVNINVMGDGAVDKDSILEVVSGNNLPITFSALSGSHLSDVTINGVNVGALNYVYLENIISDFEINAIFTKDKNFYSIKSGVIGEGEVSPVDEKVIGSGQNALYTFKAQEGHQLVGLIVDEKFLNFNGAIKSIGGYLFSNVLKDHSLHAVFGKIATSYKINVSLSVGGSADYVGLSNVAFGANHLNQLTPEDGYHISDVIIDGKSYGAISGYALANVNSDHTIEVKFSLDKTEYQILTSSNEGGKVSPTGVSSVSAGESLVVKIVPDEGYRILSVNVNGVEVGAVSSVLLSEIQKDQVVSASFASLSMPFTIRGQVVGAGQIISLGQAAAAIGDSITFSYQPIAPYEISDVKIDGYSFGPLSSYKFANISSDHLIVFIITNPNANVKTSELPDESDNKKSGGCNYSPDASHEGLLEILLLWFSLLGVMVLIRKIKIF